MSRALDYFERQLRDTLAELVIEPGLTYEVQRTNEELLLKLLVGEQVTKQRLWELWRGEWPGWSEISFHVPAFGHTEIEWDGGKFLRRLSVSFEIPWQSGQWNPPR